MGERRGEGGTRAWFVEVDEDGSGEGVAERIKGRRGWVF